MEGDGGGQDGTGWNWNRRGGGRENWGQHVKEMKRNSINKNVEMIGSSSIHKLLKIIIYNLTMIQS